MTTRTTEIARQQCNSMPERTKRILTVPIQIAQLNVNPSPDEMAEETLRNTDILLYQEPALSISNQSQHPFLPPEILGFKTILPIPINQLRTPPSQSDGLRQRTKRHDRRTEIRHVLRSRHNGHRNLTTTAWPILVLNIYSPPTGSVRAHSIGQRMKLLNLPDAYPTTIAGDFVLHRPDWEEMTTEPIAAAIAEWLQDKSCR